MVINFRLKTHGFTVLFVTNTTKDSKQKLHERLIRLGFDIHVAELYTSMSATRLHVEKQGIRIRIR